MRSARCATLLSLIAGTVLITIVLYQVNLLFKDYARVWLSRMWRTKSLPSMERNVLFVYGNKGSQFIEFISRSVAFDQPVAVPNGYDVFSEQNLLQFFLFPRAIISCPCPSFLRDEGVSEACRSCLLDPTQSIPAIGSFPPNDLIAGEKQFLRFPGSDWYHGIYVPQSIPRNESQPFIHMDTPLIQAILVDLTLLIFLFLVGACISYSIDSRLKWNDLLALAIPLGAGSITFPLFVASWLGAYITLRSYIIWIAVILVGCVAFRIMTHRRLFPSLPKASHIFSFQGMRKHPLIVILATGLVILAALSLVIAVTRGHSSFDGIANWALKGYAIAETGSVTAGSQWGGHVLSYPQNIHLLIALFRLADGDVLPGSMLIFPAFCLALLAGCHDFWVRHGVRKEISLLGIALIFSTPVIFLHSTLDWGNLPFSAYLVLGVFYTVYGLEARRSNTFWIAGLLVAFATWTRPEGIGYAIALGVLLLVTGVILRVPKRFVYAWFVPIVLVATSWMIFSLRWIAGDEIGGVTKSFLSSFIRGDLRSGILGHLINYAGTRFTSMGTWGLLLLIAVVLLLGGAIRLRKGIPLQFAFVLAAALVNLAIPLFMFYAAAFDKTDLIGFLNVSFDRAQFHGAILLLAASLVGFTGRSNTWEDNPNI